jgi:hypothetical protein
MKSLLKSVPSISRVNGIENKLTRSVTISETVNGKIQSTSSPVIHHSSSNKTVLKIVHGKLVSREHNDFEKSKPSHFMTPNRSFIKVLEQVQSPPATNVN